MTLSGILSDASAGKFATHGPAIGAAAATQGRERGELTELNEGTAPSAA